MASLSKWIQPQKVIYPAGAVMKLHTQKQNSEFRCKEKERTRSKLVAGVQSAPGRFPFTEQKRTFIQAPRKIWNFIPNNETTGSYSWKRAHRSVMPGQINDSGVWRRLSARLTLSSALLVLHRGRETKTPWALQTLISGCRGGGGSALDGSCLPHTRLQLPCSLSGE